MKYFITFACWLTGFIIWATDAVNHFTQANDTHSVLFFGLGIGNSIMASAFLWWTIESVIDYVEARKKK